MPSENPKNQSPAEDPALRAIERLSRATGRAPQIVSCYEAGHDGFWLHRVLEARGVKNHVLDAASLMASRKARHAKTDRLDAEKLVRALQRLFVGLGFGFLGLVLAGCSSIGPATVSRDRVDYDAAMADSWKDQLVLNIVRVRYADTPQFTDVSSVIESYNVEAALTAGATANFFPASPPSGANETGNATAGITYGNKPTITYAPLTGAKFQKSLLEPIPPAAIFSFISAGYPADVIIPLTVRALNGVYNHTVDDEVRRPSDPAFYPLVEALRRIQLSRAFSMRIEKRNGAEELAIGIFAARETPELKKDIEFVQRVLGLKAKKGEIIIDYGALQQSPDELAVLSRSMLEIMQQIAAEIEVPADAIAARRTFANAKPGSDLGPRDLPLLTIHSGATAPGDAFASVLYRGSWYWVSDHDYASKRAMSSLLIFFSLAETGVVPSAPVLTIPVQ
jgi:hypothetical protein